MTQTRKFPLVSEATLDERLFLTQALAHADTFGTLSREQAETVYQQVAAIAHKLITMKMSDLSDLSGLRTQTETAFTLTSLGLEYGSKGDLDTAVRLLRKNRLVKFFQVGHTLTAKVLERARHLLEDAVLKPPNRDTDSLIGASYTDLETEIVPIYTVEEQQFLKALLTYRTTVRTLQVIIRTPQRPRPFVRLSEVDMIEQQLGCIEHRWRYVEALPVDDLFLLDPPLSLLPDPIEYLTLALMVNLVLYRQVDFQLDEETRQDFHELAYVDGKVRDSLRDQLLEWIATYLEQQQQPEPVKTYAVAFWDDCLRAEADQTLVL